MTSVAVVVDLLFRLFTLLIFVRVILSFVRVSPYHPTWGPIIRFVYEATEPVLAPVRRMLPPTVGIDFSPLIVLVLASFLRSIIVGLLV